MCTSHGVHYDNVKTNSLIELWNSNPYLEQYMINFGTIVILVKACHWTLPPWGKINIEEATSQSIYVITVSLMFLSGILKSDRAGFFFY